jgi:hypothetical protein
MTAKVAINQARQGDILFARCDLPKGVKQPRVIKGGVILESDATGHMHKLRASKTAQLIAIGGQMYVQANGKAHIDHAEHATIALPKGVYKITRQQEYEPAGWRNVAD